MASSLLKFQRQQRRARKKMRGKQMSLNRIRLIGAFVLTVALMAACQPITAEDMQSALAGQPGALVPTPRPAATEAAATEAATEVAEDAGDSAMATVTAPSLRVRAQPSESAEVVAGIREGEQYEVIGRSSDGLWLELAIPQAAQGSGWVSTNFVTVAGSITDAEVTAAPTAAPTAALTPTEAAKEPVATETAATETPASETAATETPTEEATEAPAEEAVATETPTEEAAKAPAEETAATETLAATEVPSEEASTVTPPAAGFALVTAEGARLRVRAEASTDAAIVGWVQPGETVPVVELSTDGLWVKIGPMPGTQNPDGGWVSAEFLMLGQ
jgi:uncharacterized protein YgiM (DUF1202 family)